MFDTVSEHGIRTQIVWEDGLPLIRRIQDVRPILAQNARERSAFDPTAHRRNPARFRPFMRLPWIVIQQLQQMGIMQGTQVIDEKRFRAFCNDSSVRHLRTDDGAQI